MQKLPGRTGRTKNENVVFRRFAGCPSRRKEVQFFDEAGHVGMVKFNGLSNAEMFSVQVHEVIRNGNRTGRRGIWFFPLLGDCERSTVFGNDIGQKAVDEFLFVPD